MMPLSQNMEGDFLEYRAEREEIIQVGREMAISGLVAGTWGNISRRIDTQYMAITPSAMDYNTIKSEDIVIMDLQGNIISGNRKPSNEYPIHGQIYTHKNHINAVVHTHSVYATAMAVARKPIPANIEDLAQIVGGSVSVSPYALPGSQELAHNIVTTLGDKFGVLMANHGALGVGRTLSEALMACQVIEKGAKITIASHVLGGWVELDEEDISLMRKNYLEKRLQTGGDL